MNKFAKLFEVNGEQVLFYREYDGESDQTIVHQILNINGIRVDAALEFLGDTQEEDAEKYIDLLVQEDAERIYKTMSEILQDSE